jgi:glycosyltransferase involved in cell wall biosynthesis
VTSSFNQGDFIESTIQSVLTQHYPDVEHIVVDGMSTDQTAAVLERYPHLRVIREADRGQFDAINKGFAVATGQIFCFLNSDDTFEPGALTRIAAEIDPARSRHVVMGRCRFIDETGQFIGIEHPSRFEGHRRVLEVWRGHSIPQPATFWAREVWERCGPLTKTAYWLDYDLFCRMSRDYIFHEIDQVLATYRLHSTSKTSLATEQDRLEAAIDTSRDYWRGLSVADRLRLQLSYAQFRLNRRQRARALLSTGKKLWGTSSKGRGMAYAVAGGLLGPDLVTNMVVVPRVKPYLARLRGVSSRYPRIRRRADSPQTLAWRSFEALHPDGWAGPTIVQEITIEPKHTRLALVGAVAFGGFRRPLEIEASIDGRSLGRQKVGGGSRFSVQFPLDGITPGSHQLRLVSSEYSVPDTILGNQDYRPLSFKLESVQPMGSE